MAGLDQHGRRWRASLGNFNTLVWEVEGDCRGRCVTTAVVASFGLRLDLDDPATLGCLLALAREAWDDPTLHPVPGGSPGDAARGLWWEIRGAKRRWYTGSYPTEAGAILAAILAAPPPEFLSPG